ncbi:MAG TPA: glycosyltransferase [Desulfuromonadaceae bacterium]
MTCAPVVLFVYNRPDHAHRTVDALKQNLLSEESHLTVFSDAPKSEAQAEKVREVRQYIRQIVGFKSVTIIERESNFGLARSIIDGVTTVVNKYGRIIVLEDDIVTSPYFLRYMNEALELYQNEENVISIHGYSYPVKEKLPETFFLKGADCWGWGTWKQGWNLFEADGTKLLHELKARKLEQRFDFNGTYNYTRMLKEQITGKNDSWAVRWYASALLNDKLTLNPGQSLVQNIGTDNSGIHCGETNNYRTGVATEPINLVRLRPEEDKNALTIFQNYFNSIRLPFYMRLLRKLKVVAGC